MRRLRCSAGAGLYAAGVLLGACAHSSTSYISEHGNLSARHGQIAHVSGLSTSQIEPLSDGVAVTVAAPGCRVQVADADARRLTLDLAAGAILVYGSTSDCVLEPERPSDSASR